MGLKTKLAMAAATSAAGAAMIAGGSFAYFSDSTSNTGNTFTAGTIKITDSTAQGKIFDGDALVGNLAPGDTGSTGTLNVANDTGSLDEWVGLKTALNSVSGKNDIFADLSPVAAPLTDNHPLTISYVVTVTHKDGSPQTVLASHNVSAADASTDATPFLLKPGDTASIAYTYIFDQKAGNDYQGAGGKVDVTIDAVQARNNTSGSAPSFWS